MLLIVREIANVLTFKAIINILIEVLVGASVFAIFSIMYEIKSEHKCILLLFDKMIKKK